MDYDVLDFISMQIKILELKDLEDLEIQQGLKVIETISSKDYLYYLFFNNIFFDFEQEYNLEEFKQYYIKLGKQIINLYPEDYSHENLTLLINFKLIKNDIVKQEDNSELYLQMVQNLIQETEDYSKENFYWYINQYCKYIQISNIKKNNENLPLIKNLLFELKNNKEDYINFQKKIATEKQISL